MRWLIAVGIGTLATQAAFAGEAPLYEPAPSWAKPAPPITPAQLTASSPVIVLLDVQQRLQDGQVWRYVDAATRVASPELLSQAGTVSIPWQPSNGDLIVHRAEIIRGAEHIDLLAGGKRFTVIRREQQLEQREINGELTATMTIEGLRIGDVVHTTISVQNSDATLKGQVQAFAGLPAAPFRAGYTRMRFLWPLTDAVQWKTYAEGARPVVATAGQYRELVLEGTIPKQPDFPADMPPRFQRPPVIEATSFSDWASVSRTMAPLYVTDGLIAPGSPLAAEVSRIKAEADPLRRAALALDLVQDKIRYLYNGMEGGNYRPQTPAQTWASRYGDCKAKTLLLLALLHAVDIEAEAVLAPAQAGDLIEGRLPSAGAFDHVIVKATVGGDTLWLDGTMSGTKLADLRDAPAFRTVLPLRSGGAELTVVPFRAPARIDADVTIDADQRAGITMPTLVKATIRLRGPGAAMVGLASTQATPDQKREIVQEMVNKLVGETRLTDQSLDYDIDGGIATVTASGMLTTAWNKERGRRRLTLDRAVGDLNFTPDRARPAWRALPVSLGNPGRYAYHTRLRLPREGKGFTLAGDQTLSETIAGRAMTRQATLIGDLVSIDDEIVTVQPEIAADAVVATRTRVALAQGRKLEVVAPADLASHDIEVVEARRNGTLKPLSAAYARAIANDPEDKDVYVNRARFFAGIFDYAAAIPDVTKALTIEPAAETYLWRASLYEIVADSKKQLGDLEEAMKLDPSSVGVVASMAQYRIDHGQKNEGIALVQERIDAGGKETPDYQAVKADLLARVGDADGALATIDEAVVANPGNANLLNSRCWIKGTLNVQLDSALKDCTRSIELSESGTAALDSRAMVYFRLNRMEEAMADLTAALQDAPGQSASLYMRGVILGRQGKTAEARADIVSARMITPLIDQDYGRWGIKP